MATVPTLYPNANGEYEPWPVNIANANEGVILAVTGWDYIKIQATYDTSMTLGSLVLKVQQSLYGSSPEDFSTPVTLSVKGVTELLHVTAVGYIHATVTTAGTSGTMRLTALARTQVNP